MREFASRFGRAELEVFVTTQGESFPARSANIGMGGLFVRTERPLPVGARLALDLTLPDHVQAISVDGEVRWILEKDGRTAGVGQKGDGRRSARHRARPPRFIGSESTKVSSLAAVPP